MKGVHLEMKKQLLIAGLSSVFVIAGCGQSEDTADKNKENENQTQEEATNGDKKEENNKQLQSTLLDTQLELAKQLRPHNVVVQDIQAQIKNLSTIKDEQELATAKAEVTTKAVDVQKEVEKAIEKLNAFSIKGELSDENTEKLNAAMNDLKAYFNEVKTALDNPVEADFTKADEEFSSFEEKLGSLYEKAGLLAPNMNKELS